MDRAEQVLAVITNHFGNVWRCTASASTRDLKIPCRDFQSSRYSDCRKYSFSRHRNYNEDKREKTCSFVKSARGAPRLCLLHRAPPLIPGLRIYTESTTATNIHTVTLTNSYTQTTQNKNGDESKRTNNEVAEHLMEKCIVRVARCALSLKSCFIGLFQ